MSKAFILTCGYFVSTTLKHYGVNVNRFRLAQAYSLKSVEVLHDKDEIDLSGHRFDSTINYLLSDGENGFYTVGLDNYIGFLLKRKEQVYSIHSSYTEPGTVCIELAESALALQGHHSYVLAQLSGNEFFIRKWIEGSEFKVP